MKGNTPLGEWRGLRPAGLLLVGAAVGLGLALSLGILLLEMEQRASPAAAAPPEARPVASAAPVAAPPPGAAPAPAAGDPAAGKTVFVANCTGCHPKDKAGIGPDLTGLSGDTILRGVRGGKGAMPAFSAGQIGDQQMRDLIAYLSTEH